jgi:hypothetical protein
MHKKEHSKLRWYFFKAILSRFLAKRRVEKGAIKYHLYHPVGISQRFSHSFKNCKNQVVQVV